MPAGLNGLYDVHVDVQHLSLQRVLNVPLSSSTSSTIRVPTKPTGDPNGDGLTTRADIPVFVAAFDRSRHGELYDPHADFNADGRVNLLDASILVSGITP